MQFFLCLSLLIYSQTEKKSELLHDSLQLNEIEVTAARYPQRLRSLAAPVQIVSAPKFQIVPTGDLSAALASVPGVQLQSGSFQTIKLTLRGIGSRSQYSTNRTRVYIDEIPLTTGDGTSVFDDIELNFLSRAEVTKGSYSAWYGSGMGGSLRFISHKASDNTLSAEVGITAASAGLLKFSGLVSSNFKSGNVFAGITRLTGNGFRENSAFSRGSGLVSGNLSSAAIQSKISFLLMLSDVHAFTPSSVDEQTFLTNPTAAAPNWLNVKGFKAYKRLLAGVKVDTKLSKNWSNTFLITGNYYDQYELRPFNILDDRSLAFSVQETARFSVDNLNLSFGLEALNENYTWQIRTNNSLEIQTDALENRTQLNGFAAADWQILELFRVSVAANMNFTNYNLQEIKLPDRLLSNGKYQGKAIFTPMAGLIYDFSKSLALYSSVGHGFSNPTVEESLNSQGMMNAGLKPEKGWTFDLGFKSRLADRNLNLSGSAYIIYLNDLLVTKRPAEDVFYGENAGSAVLKGFEIALHQRPFHWLTYNLSANVSDNRFRYFTENNISYAGKIMPGIPNPQLYADCEITLPWQFRIHTALRYTGIQYADDANLIKVRDWKTIDAGIRYETKLQKKLQLNVQIAVNNLFDEHYASMILINAPSFSGRAPRYYYPAQSRNVALNFKLRWK